MSNSVTPWTVARQAPLPVGFSRQEYWSGLPCPPPGDLPNPGIKARSPTLWVDYLPSEHQRSWRILEWVAYLFSRGSSWPRSGTGVSCIAGGFLAAEILLCHCITHYKTKYIVADFQLWWIIFRLLGITGRVISLKHSSFSDDLGVRSYHFITRKCEGFYLDLNKNLRKRPFPLPFSLLLLIKKKRNNFMRVTQSEIWLTSLF